LEEQSSRREAKDIAGESFDAGDSCTLAVLRATLGQISQELQAAASGFHSGIGKSGCLCGAVSGGVMALGVKGAADRSAELISNFKAVFGTTCCRGLSGGEEWMSEELLSSCRRITVTTAGLVESILREQ